MECQHSSVPVNQASKVWRATQALKYNNYYQQNNGDFS